jgi:hypothetical protein
MSTHPTSPNGLYFLNEHLSSHHISQAIGMYLSKAQAMAVIATLIDVEGVKADVMESYLWTLSDILQEVKWLHDELMRKS